jgi:hypothetical protein
MWWIFGEELLHRVRCDIELFFIFNYLILIVMNTTDVIPQNSISATKNKKQQEKFVTYARTVNYQNNGIGRVFNALIFRFIFVAN